MGFGRGLWEREQTEACSLLTLLLSGLAAAARSAAVFAFIAGAVARHDTSAFGAQWSITHDACVKRKRDLRIRLGGPELRGVAGFGGFRDAKEASPSQRKM